MYVGESFAMGAFNTLRLCDRTGVCDFISYAYLAKSAPYMHVFTVVPQP